MCGRYTLTESPEEIANAFSETIPFADPESFEESGNWQPRFNIAPKQYNIVASSRDNQARLESMRWGLVPHWAKDEKISTKLINARAETVAEKPSFREAFKTRRCLVFATGYYEWTTHNKVKRPVYITAANQKIIAFAGLWASWHRNQQKPLNTYTIVTTSANADLTMAHHRMPVVLNPEDFQAWISPETPKDEIFELLRPSAGGTFTYHFVSNYVNSPRNEGHQCIQAHEVSSA